MPKDTKKSTKDTKKPPPQAAQPPQAQQQHPPQPTPEQMQAWQATMMRYQMMQMQPWMMGGMMGSPMGMMNQMNMIDPTQPGMPNAQPPSSKSGEAPSSNNPSQQHDPSQLISLFHQNQTMHPPFNPMAAMMMQNPFMNANANAAAAIPSYPPPPMFQNPQSNREVATAHGIINKINKKVKRKKKGKPKRPLSAYNLFFRDERTRILNTIPEKESEEEESKEEEEEAQQEDEPKQDEKEAKQEDEPKEEEKKKAGTKKKKTTPHGKIGFESLAKLIGKRWQGLDPAELDKYKKLAEVDSRRYRADMEVWLKKENEKSRDGADDESEEPEAKKLKTGD